MSNAETPKYTPPAKRGYHPSSNIGTVPSVVVGGHSEVAPLPAMPGTLRIGEDKNVSTPVSG